MFVQVPPGRIKPTPSTTLYQISHTGNYNTKPTAVYQLYISEGLCSVSCRALQPCCRFSFQHLELRLLFTVLPSLQSGGTPCLITKYLEKIIIRLTHENSRLPALSTLHTLGSSILTVGMLVRDRCTWPLPVESSILTVEVLFRDRCTWVTACGVQYSDCGDVG
jgi:hypothetical protein